MTTPSDSASPAGDARQTLPGRLHPWSWLFVLLAQLRSFALPLIAVFVFGGSKGEQWQFLGMLAGVVLGVVAVVQYFTYRYGVIGDELVIRAGILHRNRRHIPLARIRNVSLQQNLLHRLFHVAEVRLESAGGTGAEATMRVLSLDAARSLEVLIEGRDPATTSDLPQAPNASTRPASTLLQLGTGELLRLGLLSNRGMVVVAAASAALWQVAPDNWGDLIGDWAQALFNRASEQHLTAFEWAASGVLLIAFALLVLRLLSMLLAVLHFHGFTLQLGDGRLSVERGLFTRVRASAPPRKIQFWNRRESLLQRLLGRQSLHVETAVVSKQDEAASALNQLAPIATPQAIDRILCELLPIAQFETAWRPVHPRAWRRMVKWPIALLLILSAILSWRVGPVALLLLLLVPLLVLRARRLSDSLGWTLSRQLLRWRSGWLNRQQSFAEVSKLQGIQLHQSPFDRRHRMATLSVDTAGASPLSGSERIVIRYLPEDQARRLYRTLAARISATPLSW